MTIFKTHVALNVADVNRSVAFYQAMFEAHPVKHKVGYAKFEVTDPGLNLTLNVSEAVCEQGALSHLGIQVDSTEAVRAACDRFKSAGLKVIEEFNTDCCYALQDKVWVIDPDGNRWEIFVVHAEDTAPDLEISIAEINVAESTEPQPVKPCCA
ncbi:MAG: ArsI/CadI family heavy metal resistance metalloenzyme [Cyanobacteria bacterium P01_A01_bin.116]